MYRDVACVFGLKYIRHRIYGIFRREARLFGLRTYLERGQSLSLRPFHCPPVCWLLSCTNKHSTMAGTRASGKLLANCWRAVCQRMRSSNSSTSAAATFRRSRLIHTDDSHSAAFLLDPINFKLTAWVANYRQLISCKEAGVVRRARVRTLGGWPYSTVQPSCQAPVQPEGAGCEHCHHPLSFCPHYTHSR
jgi:hypothetical protein